MAKNLSSPLFKNITAIFSTQMLSLFVGLLSTIIVARFLGAEGRGMLAAVFVYPQLFSALVEGGMRQAAMYFTGKKLAEDDTILGCLFIYIVLAGSLGTGLVITTMYLFGPEYLTLSLIVAVASTLPLTLSVNAFRGVFLGKGAISSFNRVVWWQKALNLLLLILFEVVFGLSVFLAVLSTLVSSILNFSLTLYLYFAKSEKKSLKISWRVFSGMFKKGIVYAVALFLIDANYKADILLMTYLSSEHELGLYALSVQLSELNWQLVTAVVFALMSASSSSTTQDLYSSVAKSARLTFWATLICSLFVYIGAFWLTVPIFGESFKHVPDVMLWLIPGIAFGVYFKVINAFYAGRGEPHYSLIIMAISVSLNIVLNLLLIPKYGATGAAVSTSISYFFSAIVTINLFKTHSQLSIRKFFSVERADLNIPPKSRGANDG
ncbi:polysaccharide biosynthesis C-terminal domain-containing protein [Alteromonas macleodii]|uniref:oligosaccharide flippase family protein n=1 Tax=Alteromonas macleodii TaxID=28108 RepID=UPI003655712E